MLNNLKETLLLTLGRASVQLSSLLLLPLYTRHLTVQEFGLADVLLTVGLFAAPVMTMAVEQSCFKYVDLSSDKKHEYEKSIASIFQIVLLGFATVNILIFSINIFFKMEYTLLLMAYTTSLAAFILVSQLLRAADRTASFTITNVIFSITAVITGYIAIDINQLAVEGMLCTQILANTLSSIFAIYRMPRIQLHQLLKLDLKAITNILTISLPLLPNTIAWFAITGAHRGILVAAAGATSAGLLAVGLRFSSLLNTAGQIVTMAWQREAFRALQSHNPTKAVNLTMRSSICLLLTASSMLTVVSIYLFPWMIDSEYLEAIPLLPALITISLLNMISGLYGPLYVAAGKTRLALKSTITSAIVGVTLSIALAIAFQIEGVIIAMLVSSIVMLTLRNKHVTDHFKTNVADTQVLLNATCLAACVLSFYISIHLTSNYKHYVLLLPTIATLIVGAKSQIYSYREISAFKVASNAQDTE